MVDFSKFRGRFGRKADLTEQVKAYRVVFNSVAAKLYVLPDLAEFCGVLYQAPHNPYEVARMEGRRDVWLRVQSHLNLTAEEVYALMKGNPTFTMEEKQRG